jgi:hypothetical protein
LTPGEKNKTGNDGAQQNSEPASNNPAQNNPAPVENMVYIGYRQASTTEIIFEYSLPIQNFSLNFDSPLEYATKKEGRELRITFNRPIDEGKIFTATIQVKDSSGKSLDQTIPFIARNDHIPDIIFNEIRTEYTKPRAEFVEFLILKTGNLGAIKLFISENSLSKPIFEFPPVEVKIGDYIVLHLRTIEDGCVDETGSDLTLSGGTDARDNARDFWIEGTSKPLHKTGALWLMDQNDRIIDAVVLCEKPSEWSKYNTNAAAEFLEQKGAWFPSGDLADAVITSGSTITRSISRDETLPPIPRAENWYITANSGVTPGTPNNPKRYTP